MIGREKEQKSFWKNLSTLDWVAVAVCVAGLWVTGIGSTARGTGFLRYLAVIAAGYLLFRFWSRLRSELLWSLRNRLIVVYVFIAVIPIILLLTLAIQAGRIIYSQFGAYLLYHEIHDRVQVLNDSSEDIAAAEASLPANEDEAAAEKRLEKQILEAREKTLPGLTVNFHMDPSFFEKIRNSKGRSFAGMVQTGNKLRLEGIHEVDTPRGQRVVELSVPVEPPLLEKLPTSFGQIDVTLWQRVDSDRDLQKAVRIGGKDYLPVAFGRVKTRDRVLPEASNWIDPVVDGFSQMEAAYVRPDGRVEHGHPVFAFFKARSSQLNQLILASLGDLSTAQQFSLEIVAIVFLVIELVALVIGVVLTRAITHTVSDLYRATQFVQEGNFAHKVQVTRRDQLGVLGDSFNSMTNSISRLIDEQKQLQRLENEISIASEVQNQLFPRNLPRVEGVEVEAICRAARTVSGDYYDFIQLSPTRVAFAIADISGKGISAALLMASLQAALRSQLLVPGSERVSTAELVGRLNKHLVINTGDDRFATFFVAIYDTASRTLRYTNAGHLPGFCLCEGRTIYLHKGGIVLGVVDDYEFEEETIEVPRDAVLIGYSDGLIEPENAYGEQFGIPRLEAAAQRLRQASPRKIAESLMVATEEWSGSPEQADDMTIIVAKLR
jgi:sigma-B regulation protein RsbU (phosphoserine phosphatase)